MQVERLEHPLPGQGLHIQGDRVKAESPHGHVREMDKLATEGASVYKSAETQEFLFRLCIKHRVASAYNPPSNQLADGAVEAAKRMLRDNSGAQGTLDTNKFLAALLTHRNEPDPKTTMSNSNVIFGRRIKDLIYIKPAQLKSLCTVVPVYLCTCMLVCRYYLIHRN